MMYNGMQITRLMKYIFSELTILMLSNAPSLNMPLRKLAKLLKAAKVRVPSNATLLNANNIEFRLIAT